MNRSGNASIRVTTIAMAAMLAIACSRDAATNGSTQEQRSPQAVQSVTPTGKIITIAMITDEKGNYFSPSKIEAHRGDVLRFVLKTGVHNVHFLPDSNPGKSGLPPASEFLQIPGQEWDFPVTLAEGHYVFQCDPHAALGMIGRLEVEDED
jgi:plastocyanin